MTLCDPLADMLNRIRNALHAGHLSVMIPYSRLKHEICQLLLREGFFAGVAVEGSGVKKSLRVDLKYDHPESLKRRPVIRGLRRVSRPGCRIYKSVEELRAVRGGTGVAVISTSAGIMTDHEARKRRCGGEVICEVW